MKKNIELNFEINLMKFTGEINKMHYHINIET